MIVRCDSCEEFFDGDYVDFLEMNDGKSVCEGCAVTFYDENDNPLEFPDVTGTARIGIH